MGLPPLLDSPISRNAGGAKLVRKLPSAPIVQAYKDRFNYDSAEYFAGIPEVGLYECAKTGLQFFYPYSLCGKESLYQALQKFAWNYKESKWEHEIALNYLRKGDKVLDVGCGQGAFLHKAQTVKGAIPSGIELNSSAAEKARQRGVEICEGLLSQHGRVAYYDVVASFQVLEHVVDPHSFVEECLRALRPGGVFILGVPNRDGFLGMDEDAVLNGPPHHMALWNRASLTALTLMFPIEVQAFEIEPLAELEWYRTVMERRYLPRRWQRTLYYKLGGSKVFARFIRENAMTIAGHTIMAIFRKLPADAASVGN